MQASPSDKVTVDVRILADLRSRLLTAENTASTASKTEAQLKDAEEEIVRLKLEIEDALSENIRRTATESELSEALRIAQTTAWESNKDRTAAETQLELARSEVEGLTAQLHRINNSKAWKAVSAYRRVVKRLRLSR